MLENGNKTIIVKGFTTISRGILLLNNNENISKSSLNIFTIYRDFSAIFGRELAEKWPRYDFYYCGPCCGARRLRRLVQLPF